MDPLTRRQHVLLLLLLVPLLATVAAHVVFYRRFPWQPDYRFPIAYVLTVATVMLSCWTINLGVFRRLDHRLPFSYNPTRRILKQIAVGGTATLLTFFIVFPGAIRLYTGSWPNAVQLTSGIFVCLTIATLINGGYVGLYLLRAFGLEKQQTTEELASKLAEWQQADRPITNLASAILIDAGSRQFRLQPDEIAYFFSTQGIVLLIKADGCRLTTTYTSFAKLEDRLPSGFFFQLNRQFIVSLSAIRRVQDADNRRLFVTLTPALHQQQVEETVTVSRYRSAAFRKWFRQTATARPLVNGFDTIH